KGSWPRAKTATAEIATTAADRSRKSERLDSCMANPPVSDPTNAPRTYEGETQRRARLLNVILPRRIAYVQRTSLFERQHTFDPAAIAGDLRDRATARPFSSCADQADDSSGKRPNARGAGARATNADPSRCNVRSKQQGGVGRGDFDRHGNDRNQPAPGDR